MRSVTSAAASYYFSWFLFIPCLSVRNQLLGILLAFLVTRNSVPLQLFAGCANILEIPPNFLFTWNSFRPCIGCTVPHFGKLLPSWPQTFQLTGNLFHLLWLICFCSAIFLSCNYPVVRSHFPCNLSVRRCIWPLLAFLGKYFFSMHILAFFFCCFSLVIPCIFSHSQENCLAPINCFYSV